MNKLLILIILFILVLVYVSKIELFNYIDQKLIANVPIDIYNLTDAAIIKGSDKKAYLFNKNDSYLQLKSPNIKSPFTLTFMIKLNEYMQGSIIHSQNNLIHLMSDKGMCKLELTYENSSTIITHPYKFNLETWHYVALVFNNDKINIIIDGYEIHTNNQEAIQINELRFGNSYLLNNSIMGYIGDINYFSYSLEKNAICSLNQKCSTESKKLEAIVEKKFLDASLDQDNTRCVFKPRGMTELACKDRCMNRDDQHMWGGDKCTEYKCSKICKSCDNHNDCNWLKNIIPIDKLPLRPIIKGYSLDSKIKITWGNPFRDNLPKLFVVFVNNLSVVDDTVNKRYIVDQKEPLCEYIISNLNNGDTYSVYIKSKNDYGYSENSNKVLVIPTKSNVIEEPTDSKFDNDISANKNLDENIVTYYQIESMLYNTDGTLEEIDNNDISNNDYKRLYDTIYDKKFKLKKETNINFYIK